MADSTTANYLFVKPEIGASEDTWGGKLNGNWDALDTLLGGVTTAQLAILNGATITTAELNTLDGVTSTTAELNILDGATITTAELNILDGVTAAAAELNYVDITTLGTSEPSKVLTADAGGKVFVNGAQRSNVVAMGGTVIDCSVGNYFTVTISANTTFSFSNVPSGASFALTLELTQTSGAVTWPASVKFPGDVAPTLTTGKTHVFVFITDDGGARFRGAALVDYTN